MKGHIPEVGILDELSYTILQ